MSDVPRKHDWDNTNSNFFSVNFTAQRNRRIARDRAKVENFYGRQKRLWRCVRERGPDSRPAEGRGAVRVRGAADQLPPRAAPSECRRRRVLPALAAAGRARGQAEEGGGPREVEGTEGGQEKEAMMWILYY